MQEQTTTTANITIDDVRLALCDTSPFDTNAGKLRALIGRGSNATIQRHIDALRATRLAAAQPQAVADAPSVPADLVAAVWSAAWSAAQVRTLGRLESLSAERDGLLASMKAQASDIVAQNEQIESLESRVDAHAAETGLLQQQFDMQAQALALAQAQLARVISETAHAAELAALTAQVERQTLQSANDRLSDQLAELKALHIVAATTK